MESLGVGKHRSFLQQLDQQKSIQEAAKRWRHVLCNASKDSIFISPNLLLFDSLSQVEEYVKYSTGLLSGLDDFTNLLQKLPVHQVGTIRQFSELCSQLTRYASSSSRLEQLDEFLYNNKVRTL